MAMASSAPPPRRRKRANGSSGQNCLIGALDHVILDRTHVMPELLDRTHVVSELLDRTHVMLPGVRMPLYYMLPPVTAYCAPRLRV